MQNLLNENMGKSYGHNEAQAVSVVMGLVVIVILVIAVAIPVTVDVVSSAGLTGTTKTVVDQIPVLLAAMLMAWIAYSF